MREVRISDTTMKSAEASKSLSLSFKEKLELAKLLDRLGVDVVEVEGVSNRKVDSLRIKSIASIVKNGVLAVPVALDGGDIDLIWNALAEAKSPRLQVMASVSPAQMEYLYHKKAPAMLDSIEATVAACAEKTVDVEFIAQDATRADGEYLVQAIERAIKAGATTVTLYDEAGQMMPDQFGDFIDDLLKQVPELDDVALGISCSDGLFMANACAIAGIAAGAVEVKASSYPVGTVSVEQLAKILSTKGSEYNVRTGVRTTEIKRIMGQVARICGRGTEANSPLVGADSEEDGSIQLTASDSLETVKECAAALGYDLSPEDALAVYDAFQRIAVKKDFVGARELDTIIASAAMQVPETYVIDNYVVNSGNIMKATARVCVRKGDEALETVAMGDGPIDAAFFAMEDLVGRHFELDEFRIQAVTEGHEAMGETLVKLMSNGKLYSGRGISTDIVGAAIRAYMNAVNKIVYEEQN